MIYLKEFEPGTIVEYRPQTEERHIPLMWRFPKRQENAEVRIIRAGKIKAGQPFMVMGTNMRGMSLLAYIDGLMVEILCPVDLVVVSKV